MSLDVAAAPPLALDTAVGTRGKPPAWMTAAAWIVPTVLVAAVAVRSPHWCLLPIWACGLLTARQAAIELWSSRTVLCSATAVWGFLVHLVFLAPLLHLELDYWVLGVTLPADMRPWLGILSALTFGGLALMLGAQEWVRRRARLRVRPRIVRRTRFLLLGGVLLLLPLAAGWSLHVAFGGFGGFVAAFERGLDSFRGWGPAVMVAGMLPTTAAAVVLGAFADRPWLARLGVPLHLLLFVTGVVFAGLNGSRSNTVFALLWALVVWHHMVRPVRWTALLLVGVEILAFLYLFGFYKDFGREGLRGTLVAVTAPLRAGSDGSGPDPPGTPTPPASTSGESAAPSSPSASISEGPADEAVAPADESVVPTDESVVPADESVVPTDPPAALPGDPSTAPEIAPPAPVVEDPPAAVLRQSARSLPFLILLDLGRFDVQAVLVERYHGRDRPPLAWGRTYVAGALSPVPRRLFPGKPPGKEREGTDALLGEGTFAGGRQASNQYGLAGEAVLNFGPLAVPFAYGLFGLLLGWVSRLERDLGRGDPRWLLMGFAPMLMVRTLMIDSDNLSVLLVHCFLLLAPLVWLGSERVVVSTRPSGQDGVAG